MINDYKDNSIYHHILELEKQNSSKWQHKNKETKL